MKKILFAWALILAVAVAAVAQDKPIKGSYAKAQSFLEKGELAEAKKYIDAAGTDPKQTEKGKFWLVKGMIYQKIALSDDAAVQALAPDAFDVALASYDKVRSMEKPGSALLKELDDNRGADLATGQIIPSINFEFYKAVFDKGAAQYEAQDFKGAMGSFERSYKIMKEDTLSAKYAMICADYAEDDTGVERNARALIGMNYTDASIYISLARRAYKASNWEKVLEVAKEGQAKNPSNADLVKFLTEAYISLGRKDEAVASLQATLAKTPNDKVALFQLGTMYDELKEYTKSKDAFSKAIEIDPSFYEAYFNFFAMYSHQYGELEKARDGYYDAKGKATDEAKVKELSAQIKQLQEDAVKLLEKCHEMKPDNRDVLNYMEYLYDKLYIDDKRDAVRAKLKALGEE